MAFHGIEHFSVIELQKLEVESFFELQYIEESYIRDYGTLNTINGNNDIKSNVFSRQDVINKKRIFPKQSIKLPPKEEIIKISMEASPYNHLSSEKFISLFTDEEDRWDKKFSNNDDENIHISAVLLECLGYEGEFKTQQYAIKRFLKSNNIQPLELSSIDPRIDLYPTIREEMKNMKPNAIANRKWLIIEPREFKKVIMKLNTKNGDKIREYYIRLEELIKLYLEYSLYFKERESKIEKEKTKLLIESLEQKMDQMKIDSDQMKLDAEERHDELMDKVEEVQYDLNIVGEKLDIAVEDRSPKVKAELLRERFIIFKRNDERALSPYYVMRGQDYYINGKLPSHRKLYPNLAIIFDISCQPNPRNLFVRFKELKDPRFRVIGNNIRTTDEDALIEVFNRLNDEKRNVELK